MNWTCRYCQAPIIFIDNVKNKKGVGIPLEPGTDKAHRCFERYFQEFVDQRK